jgi:hypothetical protein
MTPAPDGFVFQLRSAQLPWAPLGDVGNASGVSGNAAQSTDCFGLFAGNLLQKTSSVGLSQSELVFWSD